MLFSKPYHITNDDLFADRPRELEGTPIEYHVNQHSQLCSACCKSNTWSELTLVLFHDRRKCRIVRAAPALEYNIPLHIHHHEAQVVPVCGTCAELAQFATRHLPTPERPVYSNVRPLWRQRAQEKALPASKRPVTDDDLIA